MLHDSSEAYLLDQPTTIKRVLGNGHYLQLEDRIMRVIATKFGFTWPVPEEVKIIDRRLLTTERHQAMIKSAAAEALWGPGEPPFDIKLEFWRPEQARTEFLDRFYRLHPACPAELRRTMRAWGQL